MIRLAVVLLALLFAVQARAHEIRPGYLEIRENAPGSYDMTWKVPALGEQRLVIEPRLPADCLSGQDKTRIAAGGAFIDRWTVQCETGLAGKEIGIEGLDATATDVLVRLEHAGSILEAARLTPTAPAFTVKGVQSTGSIGWSYFLLGVDHILTGIDHLLFVLALVLLVPGKWQLVKTVTAFTVAHSITLAGASLGLFNLPQRPVEAVIALSIVFVAAEVLKAQPGQIRLSQRFPWMVAFAFGLLHGFGFAGALAEIGLPQSDVPLALLAFNLGVEAGQLLFIGAILAGVAGIRQMAGFPLRWTRVAAAYEIGILATFWLIERLAGFAA